MKFNFRTADRIVFGEGAAENLAELVKTFGNRVLLALDQHIDSDSELVKAFGDDVLIIRANGEPTVEGIEEGVKKAQEFDPEVLVGIGGGSTIDTAKAIGILLANGGGPLDYLEVIGEGKPFVKDSRPVVAVPTTAGTGAEVTANSPIYSPEHKVKASLRHPSMIPDISLVDPLLTVGCPASVTASAGLDALTQNLEPLTSCLATPFTDMLAREGLKHAAAGLRAAYQDGSNVQARADMSFCSLLGGLALANSKLGSVHGLAAPLGGMTGGAHGEVCASVLVACTQMNIKAMEERDPENPALEKYREAAKILTGNPEADFSELIDWLEETVRLLNVRGLGEIGLAESSIEEAADQALVASSMKGNPIKLKKEEVVKIIELSM